VTFWSQVLGLLAGLPVLIAIGPSIDTHAVIAGCIAGTGVAIALVLLYSSTRFLYIGVASAISAVVACVIPVTYGAISHPMTTREVLGVVVCVGALAAVGRWRSDVEVSPVAVAVPAGSGVAPAAAATGAAVSGSAVSSAALPATPAAASAARVAGVQPLALSRLRREVLGIGAALASGVAMSIYYIALAGGSPRVQVAEAIGSRLTASLLVAIVALSLGGRAIAPRRSLLRGSLLAGVFGIVGAICYALGVRAGTLGIIVPIVSLSPGVTIVVAWLALHERISRRQGAGLLLAMVGVVIVTA
jgi:uncharacterized membrane protein